MLLNAFKTERNSLTIHPYGVAEQLVQVYGGAYEGTWAAETVLSAISHSTLVDFDENDIPSVLKYLNMKLEATRKTISFWDAYQIRGTIEDSDADNLLSALSQLPNNSSLVNNVTTVMTWINEAGESQSIYAGDVFVKDYSGHIHLIKATNKGIYRPTEFHNASGNTYELKYEYSQDTEDVTVSMDINTENNIIYNLQGELVPGASVNFSFNTTIPIVKFFYEDDQIFIPNGVNINNDTVTLTNTTNVTVVYEVK